jgi:hypothetical protein
MPADDLPARTGDPVMLAIALLAALTVGPDSTTRARDTLILAHEFTAATEFARVELAAGQVYRVEVTDGAVLQVRALLSGVQNPVVGKSEAFPRASRTVAFELAPSASAVYEIRVGRLTRGAAPVRVYWDQHATARRQKVLHGS